MITEPGYLPLNYSSLSENHLPLHFYELLNERETIHRSMEVKKTFKNASKEQMDIFEKMARNQMKKNKIEE